MEKQSYQDREPGIKSFYVQPSKMKLDLYVGSDRRFFFILGSTKLGGFVKMGQIDGSLISWKLDLTQVEINVKNEWQHLGHEALNMTH